MDGHHSIWHFAKKGGWMEMTGKEAEMRFPVPDRNRKTPGRDQRYMVAALDISVRNPVVLHGCQVLWQSSRDWTYGSFSSLLAVHRSLA